MGDGRVNISSIALGKTPLHLDASQSSQQTKGAHYVELLYEARCNARWSSVPELVRKVEKHSSQRKCLTLAATAGARVYPNPSTENFKTTLHDLGSSLSEAANAEQSNPADILDSAVCHAMLLFGAGQPQAATAQLPEPLHRISPPPSGQGVEAWLAACVLQGTLVVGLAHEALQKHEAAATVYRSIIGYLSYIVVLPNQCIQLRHWSEELLSRICLFFSSDSHLGEAMASFHLLSKFLDKQAWKPLSSRGTFTHHSPKEIWRAYYEALSKVIREDLVYHPSPVYRDHNSLDHRGLLDNEEFSTSRRQQRAELRRVETNYETLLLQETQFPRANETNSEVCSWIELVMSNWRILCGPSWTDEELGSGGKAMVARNTLDILYRAATKTFHSTPILRHLFTVHEFLAEFDLAFKAYDTYVEIMNKGKARSERSGQAGIALDDDDTAVRFASEAIRVACRLGPESMADKALAIGETVQKWTEQNTLLGQETLAIASQAVGISQAYFARLTPLPAMRAELQQKALETLSHSVRSDSEWEASTESFYALSMAFAETRDIQNAILTVKQAINISGESVGYSDPDGTAAPDKPSGTKSSPRADSKQLVKQIPVWHLLAQLLCSREEFEKAHKCCTLALEDIAGIRDPFQKGNRSSALDGSLPASNNSTTSYYAMDNLEKHAVLELKMTQLSLVEVIEGPDAAVNGSNELLSLFSSLIGPIEFRDPSRPQGLSLLSPPKSSSGTIRSVLGRPKSMRRTLLVENYQAGLPSKTASAMTSRPNTSAATAPTLQVSSPNGQTRPASSVYEPGLKPRHNTLKKKSSSIRRPDTTQGQPSIKDSAETEGLGAPVQNEKASNRVSFQNEEVPGDVENQPESSSQPLGLIPTNMEPERKPAPSSQGVQPPEQDTRLPTAHPKDQVSSLAPLFIKLQESKQKTSLLIKIWLFIARLYTKISLPGDAKEAVEEAKKLASGLELEISQEKANISQFQERGWGGGKSVEELWADVHTEEGLILQSQDMPHDALARFEIAISHQPDHLEATVALSDILLDIYCQDIPLEKNDISRDLLTLALDPSSMRKIHHLNSAGGNPLRNLTAASIGQDADPTELSRLASRDRAYGLLSSITKLGVGWDSPEAWFVLSRAYELSGQVEKAKEALWWTVRLEDTKPIRHWRNINPGGFVL